MTIRNAVCAAGLVCALMMGAQCVGAAALWEENVYIGLPAHDFPGNGDSLLDIFTLYDSEGRRAGDTVATAEVGQFFGTMQKGSLWTYHLNRESFIQSTSTLEILAHVVPEEGACWSGREHYCIYDFQAGSIEVYDSEGNLLDRKTPDLPPDASTPDASTPDALASDSSSAAADGSMPAAEEKQIIVTGIETEDALVVRVLSRSWEGTECIYGFRRGEDGTWMDSTEPGYPEVLLGGMEYSLGRFLLCLDENTGLYDVYSSEGVRIMEGVQAVYALENGYDPLRIDRPEAGNERVSFITVGDMTAQTVYDRNLQEVAQTDGRRLESWGQTVIGLPCEVLEGRVCENVYPYCGEERVPGACEDGNWYVTVDGALIRFALPDGERLVSLNERYVQTGLSNEGDGITQYRLYRLTDLTTGKAEVVMDNIPEQMYLCAGSCLRSEGPYDDRKNILYNDELEPVLETSGFMRPASGNTYYLKRGPWHGIVDGNGSWLIRESSMAE